MGANFAIAAVTWPGSVDEVSGALPGVTRFEIGELERDQILTVIQEMGIVGPIALQAHLVNQAQGRVGLAVTLAHASLTGDLCEVATGDVLLRDIVGWYARSIGINSRYVLGFLALAGHHGATLEQVGQALGFPQPVVAELIRGLAFGGTLDEAQAVDGVVRLRVQPEALRYAPRAGCLIAQVESLSPFARRLSTWTTLGLPQFHCSARFTAEATSIERSYAA